MVGTDGNKRMQWLKSFGISCLVIAFFVAIVLVYYNMLVEEKRHSIIQDGEMSARQVETQFNEYLATSVDAIKLTAYTLEGMVAEDRSGEEILDYLIGQSAAVINAIFENTMGVYGYINGGYYDGAGWIPEEGFQPKTRPWYIEAAANNGEVALIDPYVDAQSGLVMMSLAMMLSDGDSVVSMDIYLDRIQELTENAVLSGNTDIEMILDQRNMVIAHSDKNEVGKNYGDERGTFAAALLENLTGSDETHFEFYYGDSHYIAYQARLQNDWLCLSVKDATDVFAPLKLILLGTIATISVIVFMLAAIMSSYNKNNQTIEDLTEETMLDKLTGFLNKAGTAGRMPELCRTERGMLAVLDLDSFKLVNDIYGHDKGDAVLSSFADIVRQNTRVGDVLCRIGGDEFLIFCKNVTDESVMANLALRLNKQLAEECEKLMGRDFNIPIGVSMGAVRVPEQGEDYPLLFQLADKALYQVKRNGKHGCAVYDTAMHAGDLSEKSLDEELERVRKIMDERKEADTAMWLGQEAFTSVYRFALRDAKAAGGAVTELLFLLTATESGNESILSEAAECFGGILSEALHAEDVVWRSKPTQFLVLLRRERDAEAVIGEILETWGGSAYQGRCTVAFTSEERRFSA